MTSRGEAVLTLGGFLLVAVVLGAGVPYMTDGVGTLPLVLALGVLLLAATRAFAPALFSPVIIVGGGLGALALLGWAFYDDVATAPGGAAIKIVLTRQQTTATAVLFLTAACSVLAGALLVALLTGRLKSAPIPREGASVSPRIAKHLTWLALLPLLMLFSAGSSLWRRHLYIEQHVGPGSAIETAGATLGLGAVAVLGFLWGHRRARVLVAVAVFAYWIAFLGAGSRRLTLVPILFALGNFAARMSRGSQIWLLAAGVLSLYLVGLPVGLRDLPEHGVIPYWHALPHLLGAGFPVAITAKNLLIGYAVAGVTAGGLHYPIHDLVISLNPLPGPAAGWYEIASYHRLNAYTPAAAVGELGNAGLPYVVIVCLGIGIVLAFLDHEAKRFMRSRSQVVGLVLVGLAVLFLLLFAQYNLRSSIRILYYAVAWAIAMRIFVRNRMGNNVALHVSERVERDHVADRHPAMGRIRTEQRDHRA